MSENILMLNFSDVFQVSFVLLDRQYCVEASHILKYQLYSFVVSHYYFNSMKPESFLTFAKDIIVGRF